MNETMNCDVLIIGKGPAGISASLYAVRAGMDVIVLGKDSGALGKAHQIDNYYGFPNTISGVIYQPWAFTAINDGQFALEPNQTAYQAARDAMNGWDPTYGAVYYYNPKTATSAWIRSTKTVTTIGRHVFSV